MLLEAAKGFRGFNEDFGCFLGWVGGLGIGGAERGGLGILSSVGMLPPAAVTSLQHSFPQSWNNRDPHHSPHLRLLLTLSLSHTPASLSFHVDREGGGGCSALSFSLTSSSLTPGKGSRPHKVWLQRLTTIFADQQS